MGISVNVNQNIFVLIVQMLCLYGRKVNKTPYINARVMPVHIILKISYSLQQKKKGKGFLPILSG